MAAITASLSRSEYVYSFDTSMLVSNTLQDAREEPTPGGKSYPVYTLKPHSTMPYAWDYPAARDKKLALSSGAARRVIDIMEIGDLVPFKFNVRPSLFARAIIWFTSIRMVKEIEQSL